MKSLRRHQLVYLNEAGWANAVAHCDAQEASLCLRHWSAHGLPVVVTRQPCQGSQDADRLSVGIAAPLLWGRLRLPLVVRRADISYFDAFPEAELACRLMPRARREPAQRLFQALSLAGLRCRVFGSYGWQLLSNLAYLRRGSDLDLLLPVGGADEADVAADLLFRHAQQGLTPRMDGELVFGNGSAVSWREWRAWRTGRTSSILVKSVAGVELATSTVFTRHGAVHHEPEPVAA